MSKGRLGPKMKALNERQQAFVLNLLTQGSRNYSQAYRKAYPDAKGEDGIRASAHRLAHDEKILAALKEETERRIQASVAVAAEVLLSIAEDPTHKDRLKAATSILNRGGLHESIEHKVTHDVSTDAKSLLARFSVLAGVLGVDPVTLLGRQGLALPAPEAEEGEFTEITPVLEIPDEKEAVAVTPLDKFSDADHGERFKAPEEDTSWLS